MKRRIAIMAFAVILALGMYVPASFGYSVEAGDWIRFEDSYGTLTGEMEVWASDTHYGTYSYMYNTFCLEIYETMDYYDPPWYPSYYVNDVSGSAIKGGQDDGNATPNSDPISVGTAFLYYNFYMGTLENYNFTDAALRTASADALQRAIWYLEDEISDPGSNIFLTAVISQFGSIENAQLDNNIYSVAAVNITTQWYGTTYYNQSTLIAEEMVVTPEPMTVSLLGLGILGLGLMRRRMHR